MFSRKLTKTEIALSLLAVTWLLLCFFFNQDLSSARYELYMDEQVSFDGIMKIYHSSIYDLPHQLRDGGDYRYGRIFWNLPALFSWPTWKIFGISGLIISNRMVSAILQLFSYLILLYTFVPKGKESCRLLGLFLLILLPGTLYFSHMPKPEPIQLLFLSLFLAGKFRWKKPLLPFFFLGIGLGAKISLLPGCLFVLALDFWYPGYQKTKKIAIFIVGWMTGAPILSYLSLQKLLSYWNAIKANAFHGGDIDDINWISWMDFFINNFFSSTLTGIIATVLGITSTFFLIRNVSVKDINHPSLYLFVLSMSFLAPTFLFVKRLWPMYLHVGLVLMAIAFLNLYSHHYKSASKHLKIILFSLTAFFALLRLEPVWAEIQRLAWRTQSPAHITKTKLWEKTKEISLEIKSSKKNHVLCIDPRMFYEKHIGKTIIVPFWGPFNFEKHSYCDTIFMYDTHLNKEWRTGSREEIPHKIFLEQYEVRVNDPSHQAQCLKNCYKRLFHPTFPDVVFLFKEQAP